MRAAALRPTRIRLSASTACRLRCPSCANARGEIAERLGEGFLRAEDLAGLLNASPWVREVEISGWGEPFLNPDMRTILEVADRHGVALTADNGTTFNDVTEEVLKALVEHRFRRVTCSIDGASNGTYVKYRKGGDYDRVIENVRRLSALKREAGSRYPKLTWQFVVFGHNEHEIGEARRLASELGMVFRLKESWSRDLSPIGDEREVAAQHTRAGTYRHSLKLRRPDWTARVFCHQLWEEPQFNWDGRVLGCCCNNQSFFRGNVFTDGLEEVVNGEQLEDVRGMLLGESEPLEGIPCTSCDVFLSMQASGQYLVRGVSRLLFLAARYVYNELGVRRLRQSVAMPGVAT